MGHIEAMAVEHRLPDGRTLFSDVSFRVGDGAKVALVGPNGAGKTTLLRMVAGELSPASGSSARSGGLGVMRQFTSSISDGRTLADLALSPAPPAVRAARERLRVAERALDEHERSRLRYAEELGARGEAGGCAAEVEFDTAAVAALGRRWHGGVDGGGRGRGDGPGTRRVRGVDTTRAHRGADPAPTPAT